MRPFRVIYADPPWKFSDSLPGRGRGAAKHYDVMTTEDLCKIALPPIADDALLFMWRVAAMEADALAVMHMWGFDKKSELVWVKTKNGVPIDDWAEDNIRMGMGRYSRQCHEICYIGARGRAATQVVKNHGVKSVFLAEREEHSKKPDRIYDIIETMVGGEGPFVELFARRPRPGWTSLGLELGTTIPVLV